jgi:hypothetical protein
MKAHKSVLQETAPLLLGLMLCTGLMICVFLLLDKYDSSVLLGGIAGALLAAANYFLMALGTGLAADKAQQQDVKGGQAVIQISYIVRMIGLFVILALLAKSGLCHPLALVLPLVFVRPCLTMAEIFKKKGENAA